MGLKPKDECAFKDLIFEKGRICILYFITGTTIYKLNYSVLLHVFKYMLNNEDWGHCFLMIV